MNSPQQPSFPLTQSSPQLLPKTVSDDRQFTFKIIKRRSPWNSGEDDAITSLVQKHGTGNWTLIANEMSEKYGFKTRSGKQCRERWHNHLDPKVNKDNWSEKEENILLSKHLEYGNKWSDIAKYLPGRTDNAIKNHFYSKFRKFIRKILKQINKEKLMKLNGIDSNLYNGDKIYKLLKKYKITYKNLNKETILNLIISVDKNKRNFINTNNSHSNSSNNLHNNVNNSNSNNNLFIPTKCGIVLGGMYNSSDNSNNNVNSSFNYQGKDKGSNFLNNNSLALFDGLIEGNEDKQYSLSSVNNIKLKNKRNNTTRKYYTRNTCGDNVYNNSKTHIHNNVNNVHTYKSKDDKNNNSSNNSAYFKTSKEMKLHKDKKGNSNSNNGISSSLTKKKGMLYNDNNSSDRVVTSKSKGKGLKHNKKITNNNISNSSNNNNKSSKKNNSGNNYNEYVSLIKHKKRKRSKRRKVSICLSTPECKKKQINKILPSRKLFINNKQSKNALKKFTFPCFEITNNYNNIIISKHLLTEDIFNDNTNLNSNYTHNNFLSGLLHPSSSLEPSTFLFYPFKAKDPLIADSYSNVTQNFNSTTVEYPNNNINTNLNNNNNTNTLSEDNKLYSVCCETQPQLSPVNIHNNNIFYPQSTRNVFSLDMSNNNNTYSLISPKQNRIINSNLTPNKLLLNDLTMGYAFGKEDSLYEVGYNNNGGNDSNKKRKLTLDLNVVNNQSETNAFFMESLNCKTMTINTLYTNNNNNNNNNIGYGNNTFTNNNNTLSNMFNISPISAFVQK